jgi:hypothetical protein
MIGNTLQRPCVTAAKIPVYKVANPVDILVPGVQLFRKFEGASRRISTGE